MRADNTTVIPAEAGTRFRGGIGRQQQR